jgi:hypothetical protein
MLSTPLGPLDIALGEITWALIRGLVYSLGFLTVVTALGLTPSFWAILAIPAASLVALWLRLLWNGDHLFLQDISADGLHQHRAATNDTVFRLSLPDLGVSELVGKGHHGFAVMAWH